MKEYRLISKEEFSRRWRKLQKRETNEKITAQKKNNENKKPGQ